MSQRVWLQDQQSQKWTIGGVIKSIRNNGRSYVVETESGAAYLRNRRFIKAAACRARQEVVAIRKTTAKEKTSSLKTTSVQEVMKKKVTFKCRQCTSPEGHFHSTVNESMNDLP